MRFSLAILLLAPGAWAQADAAVETAEVRETATLDEATLDRAEAQFFEGLEHYRGGRFEAAALRFQEAYVLTGHRDMLFNVARSRERLGDKEGAVRWYRSYLQSKPTDETAVIHRIRQLGGDPTPADAPVKPIGPRRPEGPEVVEVGAGPWPYVAAALGVAATVGGVVLGTSAMSDAESARAANRRNDAQAFKTSAESSALAADVLYGVGAVGIGVAVWLFLRADTAAAAEGRMEVGVTSDGASVGWSTSF